MSSDITEKQLDEFQRKIGYKFKNKSLLTTALTHQTFAHEAKNEKVEDNQRLEFFGDAVLEVITSEFLYKTYPGYKEGTLTELKSYLVSTAVISSVAACLGLGDYLRLGKGEETTDGRVKKSNLAAAFESVVAAIYLDGGLASARHFILGALKEEIKLAEEGKSAKNYKSLLQELCLRKFEKIPSYRIVSKTGPEHARTFKIEVIIEDRNCGWGQGPNRKTAEQAAAAMAFEKMR